MTSIREQRMDEHDGQTSIEISRKLLDEAIAYGHVEEVGVTDEGVVLYRWAS